MSDEINLALLPEGMHDALPPEAGREARVIARLAEHFTRYGYERVTPPLIEFEDSLLAGPGAGVARHMFRLMDPISQRMMGLRADMTTQVARIATTRLAGAPRPLRLYYSGQVLRVRGTQLRPERQFAQAGVELIGADRASADAEVIVLAAAALGSLGVAELSVDLVVPAVPRLLCAQFELDEDGTARILKALDQKDGAAIDALPEDQRRTFGGLMAAAGEVEHGLAALAEMALPAEAVALRQRLGEVVRAVRAEGNGVRLTIDPGENRGFEYQTGVSFTLFARGVRGELGRGGRYGLANGESATGFTLYLDSLMRAVPAEKRPRRIFVPFEAESKAVAELRAADWRAVRGLEPGAEAKAEARRMGCGHYLADGEIIQLD